MKVIIAADEMTEDILGIIHSYSTSEEEEASLLKAVELCYGFPCKVIEKKPRLPTWDEYHMGFAEHAATKSKDPATQVGAVAIGEIKQIVETGFNGFPRGVADLPERMERPQKYLYTSHAEENLVATAARARLAGTTVYVTHLCCARCARMLIQAGVARVVSGHGKTSMPQEEFEAAVLMFSEANVALEFMGEDHVS